MAEYYLTAKGRAKGSRGPYNTQEKRILQAMVRAEKMGKTLDEEGMLDIIEAHNAGRGVENALRYVFPALLRKGYIDGGM